MIRDVKKEMNDYIPRFYADSRIVESIITPESKEYSDLGAAARDVVDQYFIDYATWGLSRWEALCKIRTDETKPLSQRRSIVKSQMRGIGTVSVSLIKSIGDSFINGEVDVTEKPGTYAIEIKFVSMRGIPENQPDIQAALRAMVPAHLGLTFIYTFLAWNDLESHNLTWDQVDTYTWDALEKAFL